MATESSSEADLQRRAAGHAALSDVGRLRVVEALQTGDLSPRDLAALLPMPTNLLAHHLTVLQSAGLIRRIPSEADRRRTYVRLIPEAVAALGLTRTPPLPDRRVVFVCTGNSARSQLAAALWASRTGRATASAGTRPAQRIHPNAVQVASGHGLALLADRPRTTGEVLRADDAIITVCDAADGEIADPHAHWSIPDPVAVGTLAAFERAFADIAQRVDDWVAPGGSR